MESVDLSIARCVDCNYLLRDLPSSCCPECGRVFDPLDGSTMSMGRPIDLVKPWLFARLGWPAALIVALPMLGLIWLFSDPGPYYFGFVLVGLVALVLTPMMLIWPAPRDGAGRFRRLTLIGIVVVVSVSILFLQLPLRVRFALSLPAMNRELRAARANPTTGPPSTRSVGLYKIDRIEPPRYSTVWRFYKPNDVHVGFGYSDKPVHYAGVAAGAGGRLFGGWYWFSDE